MAYVNGASIGPGGIEIAHAGGARRAGVAASIGPGGIEIGQQQLPLGRRSKLQSDQEELKYRKGE